MPKVAEGDIPVGVVWHGLSALTIINATTSDFLEVEAGRSWTWRLTPVATGMMSVHLPKGALGTSPGLLSRQSNTISRMYRAPTATIEEQACWIDRPVELVVIWSKAIATFDTDLVETNGLMLSNCSSVDQCSISRGVFGIMMVSGPGSGLT